MNNNSVFLSIQNFVRMLHNSPKMALAIGLFGLTALGQEPKVLAPPEPAWNIDEQTYFPADVGTVMPSLESVSGNSTDPKVIELLADDRPFLTLHWPVSWHRDSRATAEVLEDGTPYAYLNNKQKYRMAIIKECGNTFSQPNIFWKGGIGGAHLHQDNKRNQNQFYAGMNQAEEHLYNGQVTRDKPIAIMTSRTSGACGAATYSWTDNGNWGKLGDIIDMYISMWLASKETCGIWPTREGSGNGLSCALPCDPISPLWLETTSKALKQKWTAGGKAVFSPVFKLKGQLNAGEGNGGLAPVKWANAQCDGDNWVFKDTPGDPTYVAFWT